MEQTNIPTFEPVLALARLAAVGVDAGAVVLAEEVLARAVELAALAEVAGETAALPALRPRRVLTLLTPHAACAVQARRIYTEKKKASFWAARLLQAERLSHPVSLWSGHTTLMLTQQPSALSFQG